MRKTRGFTLIELLIVMAILTLLAGILFTVFAGAKEKARQTHCMNNLKQLGAAILLYKQDYDGGWPEFAWQTYPQYVSDKALFVCPDDGTASSIRKSFEARHGAYESYARGGGDHLPILSGLFLRQAAIPETDCGSRAMALASWHYHDRYPVLRCFNHLFPGSDCDSRAFDKLRETQEVRGVIPTLKQDGSIVMEIVPSRYGSNPLAGSVGAHITGKEWMDVLRSYKEQLGCEEED